MNLKKILSDIQTDKIDESIFSLIEALYPICRSITGNGVRESLDLLKKHIPLTTNEVPTGTNVFDWTVPKEWNIRDAYIEDKSGKKVVDFKDSNLHILNYSVPVDRTVPFSTLKEHLFTLPDFPGWVPYKTSYYKENWGFCLSHNQFLQLKDEEYHVFIDSTLEDGALTYGEFYLPGKIQDEVLFSCHICHPSLCNDNLSGISLLTFLAKILSGMNLKYSCRFLFIPGTIGAITWLALNENKLSNIKYGLVTACVGDPGAFTYKKSRYDDAGVDKIVSQILKSTQKDFTINNFSPYGYDERQFCSPGINLPVGNLSRSAHGTFNEYHTSADNLTFIKKECLVESLEIFLRVVQVIEMNDTFLNLNPKCEPRLGKYGLYRSMGGHTNSSGLEQAILWVLNYSDGENTLLNIAEKSNYSFDLILDAARLLQQHGLLKSM